MCMSRCLCALFICSGLACTTSLSAGVITFTDRTSFNAAAGTTTLEDFNSFVTEVPFHTTPLDVGGFTISMTGGPSTAPDRNKIDLPPLEFSVLDVDGTAVMNVLTFLPQSLFLTFDSAITAFGADFAAFNNDLLRTNLIVNGNTISPPVASGDTVRFFGLVSDTPFTSIEFRATDSLNGDGYGIDNVAYSSAVPEPTNLVIFVAGFIALVAMRLQQKPLQYPS